MPVIIERARFISIKSSKPYSTKVRKNSLRGKKIQFLVKYTPLDMDKVRIVVKNTLCAVKVYSLYTKWRKLWQLSSCALVMAAAVYSTAAILGFQK